MRLPARFALLLLSLLGVIAVVSSAGVVGLGKLDSELKATVNVEVQRLLHVTHVRRLVRSMLVAEREYLLDPSKRADGSSKAAKTRGELEVEMNAYADLAPPEDALAVADLRAAFKRWTALSDQVIASVNAGETETAMRLSASHADDRVSWEAVIGGLVTSSERHFAERVRSANATYVLAQRVVVSAAVGAAVLGLAFGLFIFRGIHRTMLEVVDANLRLEERVRERTMRLTKRESDLRLILDGMGDALFVVGLDGKMTAERSQAAIEWFGERMPESGLASDYLFGDNASKRGSFELGISQIAADLLPLELLLEQMPTMFEREGRILSVRYRPIEEEGRLEQLLVVISDVTERVRAEQGEQEAREQQALVAQAFRDVSGYRIFAREVRIMLERVGESGSGEGSAVMRDLHTIKGNSQVYGLGTVATMVHVLESIVADGGKLPRDGFDKMRTSLERALSTADEFLSFRLDAVQVTQEQHRQLLDKLVLRAPHERILRMVDAWRYEATRNTLDRLASQARRIAESLGKSVEVEVSDNNVVLPPGIYDRMWAALVHVLRNATYHGIEDGDAREARGKPRTGRIRLATSLSDDERFAVEISDDGRGIDFDALRAKAVAMGLESPTRDDLLRLVFDGKVSTADEVGDVAGRGVGVAAVKEECERLSGRMHVHTRSGEGTSFRFSFPAPAA